MTKTYLDAILDHHRERAAADHRSAESLRAEALAASPTRGFRAALADQPGLSVIAEVKRRSPSKGDLFGDLDPVSLAQAYEAGGAACMSVLTDGPHFGGSFEDLRAARGAVSLPVIRKDFTVDVRDIYDARIGGADAVLLIVAALDDDDLAEFHTAARAVDLDVLVEIHDEAELERAMAVGATLVGVNQRDLVTFEVDQERAVRVGASLPDGVVRVGESGVRGPADARALAEAGYHAILVGETLVISGDPESKVRELRGQADDSGL